MKKFKPCTKGGPAHEFEWLFNKKGEIKAAVCVMCGELCSTKGMFKKEVI